MKRTIFYSWQSDLDPRTNRNLIEHALERALKAIRRDKQEAIEPVLDRDTSGLPGSPDIANSIFAKVALADAFVADVSIINSGTGQRFAPNPNVLIELGYAVAQLGWEKILLVQNGAFGGPELLPFDLRGRRVIAYDLRSPDEEKAGARGLRQGRLEAALRRAIGEHPVMAPISRPDEAHNCGLESGKLRNTARWQAEKCLCAKSGRAAFSSIFRFLMERILGASPVTPGSSHPTLLMPDSKTVIPKRSVKSSSAEVCVTEELWM
jgi:hypothetical protein